MNIKRQVILEVSLLGLTIAKVTMHEVADITRFLQESKEKNAMLEA